MKHIITILLLAMLPSLHTMATKEQDFVALMMERISSKPAAYPSSDYENITVRPTMINCMLDMMDSDTDAGSLLPGGNAQNQELFRQQLRQFIRNCHFEHCREQKEYVLSMGLKPALVNQ